MPLNVLSGKCATLVVSVLQMKFKLGLEELVENFGALNYTVFLVIPLFKNSLVVFSPIAKAC